MGIQTFKLLDNPVQLTFTGGVNPTGAYDALTAYSTGDSVSYQGSSYVAVQATTGNLPTDTTYWQLLAGKGDTGATGATGATGETGATGADGASLVSGGTAGQILAKIDGTDYNAQWVTPFVTKKSINLTDAQIKTLFSVPVEVLPAPGANLQYVIVSWNIVLNNSAGVYSGGGVARLQIGAATTVATTIPASFFTGGASAAKLSGGTSNNATADIDNTAMNIQMATADFTGGNAANKATVNVYYYIESTLPA